MATSDDIGDRGQWLFSLLFTELCGRDEPLLRPRFVGDKFPTFDYLVEVVDRPECFFFVQVKSTTLGYTKGPPSGVKAKVSQTDVNRMVACPVPAYVVGVDMPGERGFLLSVNEARKQVQSLPTTFEVGCTLLADLVDEVCGFWSRRDMVLTGSRFKE